MRYTLEEAGMIPITRYYQIEAGDKSLEEVTQWVEDNEELLSQAADEQGVTWFDPETSADYGIDTDIRFFEAETRLLVREDIEDEDWRPTVKVEEVTDNDYRGTLLMDGKVAHLVEGVLRFEEQAGD